MKESHLVDYIIENWNELLGPFDLHFAYKEKAWRPKWRCDITAFRILPYNNRSHRSPVYIEVKHRRNTRDLLYEISKALEAAIVPRNSQIPKPAVAVIVEYLERHVLEELFQKGVWIFRYTLPFKNSPQPFKGMSIKRCSSVDDFYATFVIEK